MRPFISTIVLIMLILATPACAPIQNSAQEGLEEAAAGAQKDAEAAAQQAQEQAEQAQNQAEAAQNQAVQLQKQAEATQEALKQTDYLLQATSASLPAASTNISISGQWPFHASQTVLVIPAEELKSEDLASITEDISIMCRVLEKNLEQDAGIEPAKRMLFPFGAANDTEGIYLEGYGVLLLLNVNFPLTPPPEVKEEEPKKDEGDPVWNETKRELYSTREGVEHTELGAIYMLQGSDHPTEKYEAGKVEQLQTTLINSLRHAANIRNLKPEDSVIITVRGCAPAGVVEVAGETVSSSSAHQTSRTRTTASASRRRVEIVPDNLRTIATTREVSGGSTIMTIRAKKADVDVFAKGKATFDQFREKVRINTYSAGGPGRVIQTVQPKY